MQLLTTVKVKTVFNSNETEFIITMDGGWI